MSEHSGKHPIVGADTDLDILFEQIDALCELASQLAEDADPQQNSGRIYDFSIRWGAMISGRLPRLAYYHGRGELSAEEDDRYLRLRSELGAVGELIDRYGLARPQDDSSDRSGNI